MKKQRTGAWAGVAAMLLSTGAMAQGYITVAAGQGHQEMDCTGIPTCDTTDTALKLVAGQLFPQGLSMEVGYLDFGKLRASNGFNTLEIRATALTLGGAYKMPFTSDFAANLRLGVASMTTKGKLWGFVNASASETKTKPYYGLGLSYAFSKTVAAEVGADFSRAELEGDKADVRAVTMGLRFTF